METAKRNVKSGTEYDALFPRAEGKVLTIKRNATLDNTLTFIPKVVHSTLHQTEKIAQRLKGKTLNETCSNIWHFVYEHITYEKDEQGKEQVRSPAQVWADRKKGVDCDCYTTFISSILTNLNIAHTYRITKYHQDHFQHIYPIVPTENGSHITIDCVVNRFNYEEPYTEKLDKKMNLEYLYGIEREGFSDYSDWEDDDEDYLNGKKEKKGKLKTALKKVAHATNRLNPATVLLRNGLLASMKLNLMKVAGKLRWAYLTEQQAKAKGISADKYQKLRKILTKLEGIFFGAGGKPENLKKAILTSKGNKDKAVNGLGEIDFSSANPYFDENTPLPALLGHDVFNSENMKDDGELGELGEPVTAASIAAATGALATIAQVLKNVGDIFPKGNKLNDSGNEEGSSNETVDVEVTADDTPQQKSVSADGSTDTPTNDGFWDKNKSWLKPSLIGVGVLGALYLGYRAMNGLKSEKKKSVLNGIEDEDKDEELNGIKRRRRTRKAKKTSIAMM